ncbi:MAG: V-type ATP synthase subunit E family protein [Alphaproteobacteria bacterium]|nr:V-type ATP synthase subunit E family protein [Alphaproteobacteria bacterium]
MAKEAREAPPPSSGVDALIAKLRDEGVSAGRGEADKIIADAKAQAKEIVDKANAEARAHIEAAHKEGDAYQSAGEEAVKTAMRDTVLDMKSRLMQRFGADVRRLTAEELAKDDTLKQMILELVGRARADAGVDKAGKVEVILPEKAAGLDELRKNPAELQKGRATKYVLGLSDEMLREGVTFSPSDDVKAGVRIRIVEGDITIDLTDEAVAALLLQHLQPRFRAVLEGIVK